MPGGAGGPFKPPGGGGGGGPGGGPFIPPGGGGGGPDGGAGGPPAPPGGGGGGPVGAEAGAFGAAAAAETFPPPSLTYFSNFLMVSLNCFSLSAAVLFYVFNDWISFVYFSVSFFNLFRNINLFL